MSENENLTNRQLQEKYAIDVDVDPYSIPLDALDSSHPSLFEFNKFAP